MRIADLHDDACDYRDGEIADPDPLHVRSRAEVAAAFGCCIETVRKIELAALAKYRWAYAIQLCVGVDAADPILAELSGKPVKEYAQRFREIRGARKQRAERRHR